MSRGFTLVEMVTAILVLGLLTGLSALAIRSLKPGATARIVQDLEATRTWAIRSGEPQTWEREGHIVRFLPDGSSAGGSFIAGGTALLIDPVTGDIRERH